MVETDVAVTVAELSQFKELEQASQLYREVFGYNGSESGLNPHLLKALAIHGGTVLGAWSANGELVGFAYGFTGMSDGDIYLYSQAVVVASQFQGKGLGRILKQAQRDTALRNGLVHMRWSFNPIYARNAHLNLDVLGAVGRWFSKDYYGALGSNRITVDWDLVESHEQVAQRRTLLEPSQKQYQSAQWGQAIRMGHSAVVPIPADVTVEPKKISSDQDMIQDRLAMSLGQLLDEGFSVVSCRRVDSQTAVYLLSQSDPSR